MIKQTGAIPYRLVADKIEILLVTSIGRRRWIIPKGMVEAHLLSSQSAQAEAWEEAGVAGIIDETPLGSYTYQKWSGMYQVEVYLLHVEEIYDDWLDAEYRTRQWFSLPEAIKMVQEQELKALIARVPEAINGRFD